MHIKVILFVIMCKMLLLNFCKCTNYLHKRDVYKRQVVGNALGYGTVSHPQLIDDHAHIKALHAFSQIHVFHPICFVIIIIIA